MTHLEVLRDGLRLRERGRGDDDCCGDSAAAVELTSRWIPEQAEGPSLDASHSSARQLATHRVTPIIYLLCRTHLFSGLCQLPGRCQLTPL